MDELRIIKIKLPHLVKWINWVGANLDMDVDFKKLPGFGLIIFINSWVIFIFIYFIRQFFDCWYTFLGVFPLWITKGSIYGLKKHLFRN